VESIHGKEEKKHHRGMDGGGSLVWME